MSAATRLLEKSTFSTRSVLNNIWCNRRIYPHVFIHLSDADLHKASLLSEPAITLRASEAAAQCIVIASVCLFVGMIPR